MKSARLCSKALARGTPLTGWSLLPPRPEPKKTRHTYQTATPLTRSTPPHAPATTAQTPMCMYKNVQGKEGVAWPRTGCGGPLLDGGQEAVRLRTTHLDDGGILSPRLSSTSASSSEKDRDSQSDMILLGSRLGIHREPAVSGQGRVAMKGGGWGVHCLLAT